MKLRGVDQLLAQIGRGVDQEPVIAISAERDRGLGALQFRMFAARRQAYRAAAIPLRNSAAGCCAQDDDAKHEPSPGNSTLPTEKPEIGARGAPDITKVDFGA